MAQNYEFGVKFGIFGPPAKGHLKSFFVDTPSIYYQLQDQEMYQVVS